MSDTFTKLTETDKQNLEKLLKILKVIEKENKEYEVTPEGEKGEQLYAPPPTIWQLITLIEVALNEGIIVTQITAGRGEKSTQAKIVNSLSGNGVQKKSPFYLNKQVSSKKLNARELSLTEDGSAYLKKISQKMNEI